MKELFEGLHIKNTIIEKLPFSSEIMTGDDLFSTCAKYSEKLAFLTPPPPPSPDTHVRVRIRGQEMLVFRKILHTY